MEKRRHLMLGFCVPALSLGGRSASLRVLPERAVGWFLKHLIWRILLVIKRPISGAEPIFLPALREGRSKPASLVDEVAQRLAGQKTPAVVEDDLVAPVVEIGAVACGCAASAAPPEGSTACGRRAAAPARRRRGRRRRSSSAPPLQGGLGHASGLQMLCWRTFPRRNLLNSTRCSYPIRHSRRRHSPGCGMPRQHRSPTMCGHCSIGSGASARSVSHPRLPGGSMKTAFSSSSARHASPMRIRWGAIPCSDGARSLSPRSSISKRGSRTRRSIWRTS